MSTQTAKSTIPRQESGWFARHWLLLLNLGLLLFVGLPWLAPVLMHLGLETGGRLLYAVYAPLCHQLPQRSFFLFGPGPMVGLEQIQAVWQQSNDPLVLRQFLGSPELGWKVAWSDRMVWMYGGLLPAGLLFAALRHRLRPLPWWGLVLFLLPMALDGGTHVLSELLGGLGTGFRYHNSWLMELTGGAFANSFYVGDQVGSFNFWMRLMTGLLFALGVVWFAYPHLQRSLDPERHG